MKIKKIYLLLCMAILAVTCAISAVASLESGFCTDVSLLTMQLPEKEGLNARPSFELQAQIPKLPDSIGIYSMTSPTVNQDYVLRLAGSRLKGGEQSRAVDQGDILAVQTATDYLSVEKASAAETLIFNYPSVFSDLKGDLPQEDALKRNADAYLSSGGILPQGYQYKGTAYLTRQQVGKSGLEGVPMAMMGVASYSRTAEGLPVEGAGSSVQVLLGDGGTVLGHTKVSRNLGERIGTATTSPQTSATGLRTFELLTPEDALKLLQQRGLSTEIADIDRAVITQFYLAYYEAEGSVKQDTMEPIYVFKGTASGKGGTTEFTEYMYALKAKAGSAPFEKQVRAPAVSRAAGEVSAAKGTKDAESSSISIRPGALQPGRQLQLNQTTQPKLANTVQPRLIK